jgi:hypothetical protein
MNQEANQRIAEARKKSVKSAPPVVIPGYRVLTVTPSTSHRKPGKTSLKLSLEAFRAGGQSLHSSKGILLQVLLDECFEHRESFMLHWHGGSGRFFLQKEPSGICFPLYLTEPEFEKILRAREKVQKRRKRTLPKIA